MLLLDTHITNAASDEVYPSEPVCMFVCLWLCFTRTRLLENMKVSYSAESRPCLHAQGRMWSQALRVWSHAKDALRSLGLLFSRLKILQTINASALHFHKHVRVLMLFEKDHINEISF